MSEATVATHHGRLAWQRICDAWDPLAMFAPANSYLQCEALQAHACKAKRPVPESLDRELCIDHASFTLRPGVLTLRRQIARVAS